MLRYCKYVAVAQSRTANGVASKTLRVYRRKAGTRKSAWDTRPVHRKELIRQRSRAGFYTRKMADMADDVDEIIDPLHPLVALLTTANGLMNGQQMFEQTQLGIGLTGDAYWHIVYVDGVPVEAWPLAPQFVRPLPSRTNMVSGYVYGRGTENEVTLDASEVIRFNQPNPRGDPFKGFGDLEKCLAAADLSVAFDDYRLNMIDNGAQPGLILIDKKGGIEQRQQLEDQLNRKFGGLAKVGRSMVLTGEVDVETWSASEKEMAFLASDDAVRETIANCHDLPVALLTLDSAALATAKAAIPQWELIGLKPRCDRIADTINQRVVPLFGDERLYVCYEEVVTKDMESAALRVRALYTGDEKSILTLNEARAELDYDAVPGGDTIPEPKPEPDPYGFGAALGGDRGKPPLDSDGDGKSDEDEPEKSDEDLEKRYSPTFIINNNGHAVTQKVAALEVVSQKAMMFGGAECSCCSHAPKPLRKEVSGDVFTLTERQLESIVRAWFGELPNKLIPELTRAGLTSRAVDVIADSLRTATEGPIRNVFLSGYNFGVQELPTPGNAQIMAALTGPAESYLRKFEGKMVRSVSETVDERIKDALADGIAAGESIPQLSQRVTETTNSMSGVAAERIARTETSRAHQSARIAAWKESGVVVGKRWMLAPDACELCQAIAAKFNQAMDLDTPFFSKGDVFTYAGKSVKFDYATMDVANAHPNDRCDIQAVYSPAVEAA